MKPRDPKYNSRLVLHPNSKSSFDSITCRQVYRTIRRAVPHTLRPTFESLGQVLGINRDRLRRILATLDKTKEIKRLLREYHAKK